MMHIEIERNSEDQLKQRIWRFYLFTEHSRLLLRLNFYGEGERASKRHKTKITKKWDRMDLRSYYSNIKREEIIIPPDVITEALSSIKIEFDPE